MTFLEILEKSKMNLKEFGEYFEIPYRTLQNWKSGARSCPEYMLKLMEYKLENEKEIKSMIKTYHIIEKEKVDGAAKSELKHYTFEMLKNYFEPEKEELPELWEVWNNISDLFDLESFLHNDCDDRRYTFEEDEAESLEAMEEANKFFKRAR